MSNFCYRRRILVFIDIEIALEFLEELGIFSNSIKCSYDNCGEIDMKIYKNNTYLDNRLLKCNSCFQNISIVKYLDKNLPKISLPLVLHCIYFYLVKLSNKQIINILNINENSLIKIKKVIITKLPGLLTNRGKIGGVGMTVQIDETACCRRRIISNPTSEAPYIRGTKWVVGAICEETGDVKLEVLEDRTIDSLHNFILNNIEPGTTIKSDGYPSYPSAISMANCQHFVVNHTLGFVNEDGIHTNTIESVWANLKIDIRNRRGVMFSHLEQYINEYNSLLLLNKENDVNDLFIKVLKSFKK